MVTKEVSLSGKELVWSALGKNVLWRQPSTEGYVMEHIFFPMKNTFQVESLKIPKLDLAKHW